MKYLAAIDIGSNATRLLIKRIDNITEPYNPQVRRNIDYFSRVSIRFGLDVYSHGNISIEKEIQLTEACKQFRLQMNSFNVSNYRACATAAFRAANNANEVVQRIHEATGIQIDIISGEEEAGLVRSSYFAQDLEKHPNTLFADVGGGSSDICLVSNKETKFIHSYPIGSMRIYVGTQQPEVLTQLKNDLVSLADEYHPLHVVGSGGSIHKIGNLFSKEISNNKVTTESIRQTIDKLAPLTIKERMEQYHLPYDRAEIIVEAAEIFLNIAQSTGTTFIEAPSIGVRDGIIVQLTSALASQIKTS